MQQIVRTNNNKKTKAAAAIIPIHIGSQENAKGLLAAACSFPELEPLPALALPLPLVLAVLPLAPVLVELFMYVPLQLAVTMDLGLVKQRPFVKVLFEHSAQAESAHALY